MAETVAETAAATLGATAAGPAGPAAGVGGEELTTPLGSVEGATTTGALATRSGCTLFARARGTGAIVDYSAAVS